MLFHAALVATPPPAAAGGECQPYTKPAHTAANIDLSAALVRVPATAANENLCEDMTP